MGRQLHVSGDQCGEKGIEGGGRGVWKDNGDEPSGYVSVRSHGGQGLYSYLVATSIGTVMSNIHKNRREYAYLSPKSWWTRAEDDGRPHPINRQHPRPNMAGEMETCQS